MTKLSAYLCSASDNGLLYYCQGCKRNHFIHYGPGEGPRWTWNGDVNKPTFSPSVLVRGVRTDIEIDWNEYDKIYEQGGDEAIFNSQYGVRCHTFITEGMVQFLDDCTHEFKGQTVPIAELPN